MRILVADTSGVQSGFWLDSDTKHCKPKLASLKIVIRNGEGVFTGCPAITMSKSTFGIDKKIKCSVLAPESIRLKDPWIGIVSESVPHQSANINDQHD